MPSDLRAAVNNLESAQNKIKFNEDLARPSTVSNLEVKTRTYK